MNEDEKMHASRLTAVHKVLKKNNLPPDMRQYWGGVAKRLGHYSSLGKASSSWMPPEKK
tara:strand:+ start:3595 stop:3771 length:177 start_codon:yes stop_codon:yes gene_type:complete